MVQLAALILWCCGGKRESEEDAAARAAAQQLPMGQGDSRNSIRGKEAQGVSGIQGSQSLDETSLSASVLGMLEKDVEAAPKLIITQAEGNSITNPIHLKINALGLEGSLRRKQDGMTYIGSVQSDGGNILNDFVIPEDTSSLGRRHLMIRYNPSTRKYYLKDLGEGSGTFVKIDIAVQLKQGYIISFGESHLVTQFDQGPTPDSITLRFLDGPKVDQVLTFQPGEKPILIGRMAECNIRFEDNSLSRFQCSLHFVPGKGWMVSDGDGKKPSTNGTWLFVDDMFEIFNNMIFKAGQTLFQARIVQDFD